VFSLNILQLVLKLYDLLHVVSLSSLKYFLRHDFTIQFLQNKSLCPVAALDSVNDEMFIPVLQANWAMAEVVILQSELL